MEHNIWFKRKRYGWGWSPATWQGWLVTLAYIGIILASAATIDERSSAREVGFTFFLPVAIATAAFIRIASARGESPRWQWGGDKRNAEKEGEKK